MTAVVLARTEVDMRTVMRLVTAACVLLAACGGGSGDPTAQTAGKLDTAGTTCSGLPSNGETFSYGLVDAKGCAEDPVTYVANDATEGAICAGHDHPGFDISFISVQQHFFFAEVAPDGSCSNVDFWSYSADDAMRCATQSVCTSCSFTFGSCPTPPPQCTTTTVCRLPNGQEIYPTPDTDPATWCSGGTLINKQVCS
jgi:hypothetical protein